MESSNLGSDKYTNLTNVCCKLKSSSQSISSFHPLNLHSRVAVYHQFIIQSNHGEREKREGSHVVLTKTSSPATALAPSMGTESLARSYLTAATEVNVAMVIVVDVKPNEAMRHVLVKSIESETQ